MKYSNQDVDEKIAARQADRDVILRHIYSVKHYDPAIGDWCHDYMTLDRESAVRRANAIKRGIWYGHHCNRAKIVHPAAWVVDAYVALGNIVEDH